MSSLKQFPNVIAEARKKAGLTQEGLASRLGLTPQAVSKWETGVGYPDVTLLPDIAQVLGIPIERLFDENPNADSRSIPNEVNGLSDPVVGSQYVAYSAGKALSSTEDDLLVFTDGSEADLRSGVVTNRGSGEIRLYALQDLLGTAPMVVDPTQTDLKTPLEPFSSLDLSINVNCNVCVLEEASPAGGAFLEANGSPQFIQSLKVEQQGGTLSITNRSEMLERYADRFGRNNSLLLYMNASAGIKLNVKVNGCGTCDVHPDFAEMTCSINGSGEIHGRKTERLTAMINGSGDFQLNAAVESTALKINGSGDVKIQEAANPEVKINGSGDVHLGCVSGNCKISINGSGDLYCAGLVDQLSLAVAGSGDFNGKDLTARQAQFKVRGSSDITVGQILESSVEELSKDASLTVLRRGQ